MDTPKDTNTPTALDFHESPNSMARPESPAILCTIPAKLAVDEVPTETKNESVEKDAQVQVESTKVVKSVTRENAPESLAHKDTTREKTNGHRLFDVSDEDVSEKEKKKRSVSPPRSHTLPPNRKKAEPLKSRSRSPSPKKGRVEVAKKRLSRSPSVTTKKGRSKSPRRRASRSRSPESDSNRNRKNKRARSKSPKPLRSSSPDDHRRKRSRTPQPKSRKQSKSPEARNRKRSKTPDKKTAKPVTKKLDLVIPEKKAGKPLIDSKPEAQTEKKMMKLSEKPVTAKKTLASSEKNSPDKKLDKSIVDKKMSNASDKPVADKKTSNASEKSDKTGSDKKLAKIPEKPVEHKKLAKRSRSRSRSSKRTRSSSPIPLREKEKPLKKELARTKSPKRSASRDNSSNSRAKETTPDSKRGKSAYRVHHFMLARGSLTQFLYTSKTRSSTELRAEILFGFTAVFNRIFDTLCENQVPGKKMWFECACAGDEAKHQDERESVWKMLTRNSGLDNIVEPTPQSQDNAWPCLLAAAMQLAETHIDSEADKGRKATDEFEQAISIVSRRESTDSFLRLDLQSWMTRYVNEVVSSSMGRRGKSTRAVPNKSPKNDSDADDDDLSDADDLDNEEIESASEDDAAEDSP